MAEPNWPRHSLRVGWFEFRRSLRAIREDTGRLLLLAGGVLVPTLLLAGLAALLAPALQEADVAGLSVTDDVRGGVTMAWLFAAFILAQRTATAHSRVVAAPFVLTTVSARTAVVGGVVAESLRALAYALPPALLLTAVAAYAFASPATLLVVPLVGCLFVVSAVTAGRVAGYAAAWLVARVPFVARHRTALSGVVALLLFGGYALFQLPVLPVSLDPALLASLPVGWLLDALVVGTPVGWSAAHAAGGLLTAAAVLLGGGRLAEAIATSLWFGEAVDATDAADGGAVPRAAERSRTALARAIRPLRVPILTGPARQVARWTLLRARREPQRLNFLLIPAFGGGSALVNMLLQGSVSLAVLAPAVALLAGWAAGAAFALNPLGDEGPVLPVTLTAVSGRAYVRGLIAPGLLALPVVAVVTVAAAAVGGYGPASALAFALVGALLAGVGATLAPLLGMWLPRYSAIRIGNSDDVRPPRLLAGVLHGALVWIPGAALVGVVAAPEMVRLVVSGVGSVPAFLLGLIAGEAGPLAALAAWLAGVGGSIRALPLAVVQVGLGGLLVVGGLLVARSAYRRAVRRFDRHEPY